MNKRLVTALGAYVVLGIIAAFVLKGNALYAVLILFGYFAVRSMIAVKAGWQYRNESPPPDSESEVDQK